MNNELLSFSLFLIFDNIKAHKTNHEKQTKKCNIKMEIIITKINGTVIVRGVYRVTHPYQIKLLQIDNEHF